VSAAAAFHYHATAAHVNVEVVIGRVSGREKRAQEQNNQQVFHGASCEWHEHISKPRLRQWQQQLFNAEIAEWNK